MIRNRVAKLNGGLSGHAAEGELADGERRPGEHSGKELLFGGAGWGRRQGSVDDDDTLGVNHPEVGILWMGGEEVLHELLAAFQIAGAERESLGQGQDLEHLVGILDEPLLLPGGALGQRARACLPVSQHPPAFLPGRIERPE